MTSNDPRSIEFVAMCNSEVAPAWDALMITLEPPEAHFGPEYREPRPRAGDQYFWIVEADVRIGLAYFRRPSPTTMTFAFGLFEPYRRRRLGSVLRDRALAHCFLQSRVHKVQCEVYSSNAASVKLHASHGRMQLEGIVRETIMVGGAHYDALIFGITYREWCEQEQAVRTATETPVAR